MSSLKMNLVEKRFQISEIFFHPLHLFYNFSIIIFARGRQLTINIIITIT